MEAHYCGWNGLREDSGTFFSFDFGCWEETCFSFICWLGLDLSYISPAPAPNSI